MPAFSNKPLSDRQARATRIAAKAQAEVTEANARSFPTGGAPAGQTIKRRSGARQLRDQ